jgi:hypothetical protein
MVTGLAWIGLRSARTDPGPVVAIAVMPTPFVSALTISAVRLVRCVGASTAPPLKQLRLPSRADWHQPQALSKS